jgi:hypothetical protein
MHQLSVTYANAKILVCLSPDNARMPIRNALKCVGESNDNSLRSSCCSASMPILFTSALPRASPLRWPNPSPNAVALSVQAAVLIADTSGGGPSCHRSARSTRYEARWGGIDDIAANRWSNGSPSTTPTAKRRKGGQGSVPTRTSPKDLLESSMGASGKLDPISTNLNTWAGNHIAIVSKQCRRLPSPQQQQRNLLHGSGRSRQETGTSRKGNSNTGTLRTKRHHSGSNFIARPSNVRGDEKISSNAGRTKTLLFSSGMYLSETVRMSNAIQILPNSLRVPPY